MFTSTDIEAITKSGVADGERLYNVSDGLYKVLIGLNWVSAVLGGIIALVAIFQDQGTVALFIAIVVTVWCCLSAALAHGVSHLGSFSAAHGCLPDLSTVTPQEPRRH